MITNVITNFVLILVLILFKNQQRVYNGKQHITEILLLPRISRNWFNYSKVKHEFLKLDLEAQHCYLFTHRITR